MPNPEEIETDDLLVDVIKRYETLVHRDADRDSLIEEIKHKILFPRLFAEMLLATDSDADFLREINARLGWEIA